VKFWRKSGAGALLLAIALWTAPALAQSCAMCRANAKATPKEGQRAINRAILIMLAPPLSMMTFGAAFIVRYARKRDRQNQNQDDPTENPS
jgi:hypothetical protein